MEKLKLILLGFFSGVLNGIFGAGGGLVTVPLLKRAGLPQAKAHATSIAVILPLSAISAALYFKNGVSLDWRALLFAAPLGLLGAVIGAKALKKMKGSLMKRLFGAVVLISALRLFFR